MTLLAALLAAFIVSEGGDQLDFWQKIEHIQVQRSVGRTNDGVLLFLCSRICEKGGV